MFSGRYYPGEVILWTPFLHCRYGVSCRGLQEQLAGRGDCVEHATIYRWVQIVRFELEKQARWLLARDLLAPFL